MTKPIDVQLRESADAIEGRAYESVTRLMRRAAAEIEGHNEAYGVLVEQKRDLETEFRSAKSNHRHTLDFLARWRELLVALQSELPDDVRIHRALAGEHPLRPAPWERTC